MRYNWQLPDWPDFQYDLTETDELLHALAIVRGQMEGLMTAVPKDVQVGTLIDTLVQEAIKTSEIEGEYLSRQDVASSIRNNLGLNEKPENVKDKKAQGAAELMVDARNTFAEKLTEKKLFEWHKMLLKNSKNINTGVWRKSKEPMQVVSGTIGKEKVHFEAPPSSRVQEEMDRFIRWFNDSGPGGKNEIKRPAVRSAIVHLYFESIHPFEDGNGRIGRVLAEKALSQTQGRPVLLSLSRKIEAARKNYYKELELAQRSNEITRWVHYFVWVILAAQTEAKNLLDFSLNKARFFDQYKAEMNPRQLKAIKKMLKDGPDNFEGGMTAQKYMSITKTSKATATRDLQELVELGCLVAVGGGRSTHYEVKIPPEF
ncbi:Fic family protein [Dyadobacter luticola]|uniref:Fic family protein n=1 Tax=Dyadobacter luticola TaxID=1979387 RepID=A0A5R9L5S9_9BACT|nr:Fic family protein [Dyadobacter luticola]TLV03739.1 Fic family protein [Dyadobacter luticola]